MKILTKDNKLIMTPDGKLIKAIVEKVQGIEGVTEKDTYVYVNTEKDVQIGDKTDVIDIYNNTCKITTYGSTDVSVIANGYTKLKNNYKVMLQGEGEFIAQNLEPQNIAKDVNILGVVGTYESDGIEGVTETDTTIVVNNEKRIEIHNKPKKIDIYNQDYTITNYGKNATLINWGSIIAENLSPQNIKKDVNILGVIGTFEGGSSGGNESTLKKCLDVRKSAEYLFSGAKDVADLTGILEYNDTENVTDISWMFEGCSKLKTIPTMNLQNVQGMGYTFDGCNSLETLHLEKLIGVEYTFSSCYKLKKLEIDSWETDWIDYAFGGCHSLKALIIRNFEIDPYDIFGEEAFGACYHLSGTQNSKYNPTGARDGYIYVPSEYVDALQENEIFSQFADQIRALEDYTVDGTTTGKFDDALAGLN